MRRPTSFDGNAIGTGTDYDARLQRDSPLSATITVQEESRYNAGPRVVSVSGNSKQLVLSVYRRPGAATSRAAWNANVKAWFEPARGRDGLRWLQGIGDDGSTALRIAVHVVSIETIPEVLDGYRIVLQSPDSRFEAVAEAVSGANPSTVTNAGNVAVAPRLELTHATHVTRRPSTVAGVGAGGGLIRRICQFVLSSSVATASNVFVFVEGVSVPCTVVGGGTSSSMVYALIDTHSDGVTQTTVDVVYGAGMTNPLAGTLSLQGWRTATSGTVLTNTQWAWNRWDCRSFNDLPGVWVPRRFPNLTTLTAFESGITAETTGGITFSVADFGTGLANDANAIGVRLAGPTTGVLSGFSRARSSMSNALAYVRYRQAGSLSWITAWSSSISFTTTSDIAFTDAVEIVAGIESTTTSSTPAGSLTLANSGSAAALSVSGTTVSVGSAQNMDRYDGNVTIGGYTITFENLTVLNGTLTVDCQARTIRSNVDGSPIYGNVTFTAPSVMALLLAGSNAVAHTTGGSLVVKHRGGYA